MIKEKLDKYLEECLYYYDLPGLCFAVAHKDFKYVNCKGYRNYTTKEPLEVGDIFHMASVSKLFTSTAILRLWEQGKLSIDQKIIEILPDLQIDDDRLDQITVRHMLSHTAAMADVDDYCWENPVYHDQALADYGRSEEVRRGKLWWAPSENKFRYSNTAYELLGWAIEEVSGLYFDQYIDREFLQPLGMKDSTFLTFTRDMSKIPAPHQKDKENNTYVLETYPYNRQHGPSSTLTTTGEDILKWGKGHTQKKILKAETYEEAWRFITEVPNNGEGMGLSWFMRTQNGLELKGHEGTDDGFRSSFWICPDEDITISVMANISRAPVKRMNKGILDMLV